MNIEKHLPRLIENERAYIDMYQYLAECEDAFGSLAKAEDDRRQIRKHRERLNRLMIEAEEFELENAA